MPQDILKIISVVVLTAVSFSSLAEVTATLSNGNTIIWYDSEDYSHLIPDICPYNTREGMIEFIGSQAGCWTLEQYKEFRLCTTSFDISLSSPEEFLNRNEKEWVQEACDGSFITICGHKECYQLM